MLNFGKRLREVRKKARWSQKKFARKLGFSDHTIISNYERGKNSPNVATFEKIAEVLGVDLHWLITGQGFPEDESPFEEYRKAVQILAPNVYTYLSKELKVL